MNIGLSHKPNAYKPNLFEEECYNLWDNNGLFKSKKRSEVFSVLLPPPNITGSLHLGHALTISIQDTIARWYLTLLGCSLVNFKIKVSNM